MRAAAYAQIVGIMMTLAGMCAAIAGEALLATVLFVGWALNALIAAARS